MTETASDTKRLELRQRYEHPPEEVFDAWTDADGMGQWMRPGPTTSCRVELDVRKGGRYTIVMIGGGGEIEHHGVYTTVDRPRRLAFTWNAPHLPGETVVTLDFRSVDEGTEVVLVHEGLPDESSVAGHTEGWTAILHHLGESLEG